MDKVQDNWSVTVGKSNKCYSATEKPDYTYIESYFFLVDDIYVQFVKIV
jgi:hypothetical protein